MASELYHRRGSSSQTYEVCLLQKASAELWGKGARPNGLPAAKAYLGPLQSDVIGIEFMTDVPPESNGHPFAAMWYKDTPGAAVRALAGIEYVVIPIVITRNSQC